MKHITIIFIALMAFLTLTECFSTKVRNETLVVHDTIVIVQPVVRESVVVRKVIERLPVATTDTLTEVDTIIVRDSIAVEIPIVSKVYEDSLFRAVVSGFRPSLDSLIIHEHNIAPIKATHPHWGIGLNAGYAITPRGAQPYIGIGITYNFVTW